MSDNETTINTRIGEDENRIDGVPPGAWPTRAPHQERIRLLSVVNDGVLLPLDDTPVLCGHNTTASQGMVRQGVLN